MKCVKCGNELSSGANFCRICGEPITKEKSLELTDNIDVSKVKLEKNNDTFQEDDTIEIKPTKDVNSKELSAMLELTKYNSSKNDTDILSSKITKETEVSSSDKIKKILEEMEPEERLETKKVEDIDEPTVLIPKDLISSYEKNKAKLDENFNISKNSSDEVIKEEPEEDKKQINEVNLSDDDLESDTIQISSKPKKIEEIKEETIKQQEKEERVSTKEFDVSDYKEEKVDTPKVEPVKEDVKEDLKFEVSNEENNVRKEDLEYDDEDDMDDDRKSHAGIIILTILFIIAICACIYLYILLMASNKQYNNIRNENDKLQQQLESKTGEVEQTKEEQPTQTQNNNSILFNGYIFPVSNVNSYSVSNNSLILKYKDILVNIMISSKIKYSDIKLDKDSYEKLLTTNGYTVDSYGTKVISEREYVVFEIRDSKDKKSLVAYSKLDDNSTIASNISTNTNVIDYENLEVTNKIIESTNKDNSYVGNSIEVFSK